MQRSELPLWLDPIPEQFRVLARDRFRKRDVVGFLSLAPGERTAFLWSSTPSRYWTRGSETRYWTHSARPAQASTVGVKALRLMFAKKQT
jgi:hypothetical protein